MTRLARIAWGLTIVYWAGLFAMTHIPASAIPPVPVTDKTAHTVSYALLATALLVSLKLVGRLRAGTAVTVLGILLAYGAIDELTQIPVGRSCELADWNADAAGAGTAVVLVSLVLRKFKPEH